MDEIIRKDIIGREIKVGDKIIHFWILKGKLRPKRGYITRFTKKCAFICWNNDWEEATTCDKKDRGWWEKKVGNTEQSILKHDWEKEWKKYNE